MRLEHYKDGGIRIQPRGGRSNTLLQKDLMEALESSGADILPITIDSNTRLGRFKKAEALYTESKTKGIETLNGYPLLAVDFIEVEAMLRNFAKPISLRHGSPLADKLISRALALGIDEIEGGPLTYLLPYSSSTKIPDALKSWEEVERMTAKSVSRFGNPTMRESFGVLTAVLVHPYVALLVSFIEAIFASRFGVKHFMIGLQSTGNISQDRVQFEAARKIASSLKYQTLTGVEIYYAYHHWMGPFPKSESLANKIIDLCNISAFMNQVDKVVVKTAVEAHGIPTVEANISAVKRTKAILDSLNSIKKIENVSFSSEEVEMLSSEVLRGLEKILNKSESLSASINYAINIGWIDLMFSPHHEVNRKIWVCRDDEGWLTFADFGNLGLSKEFISRERARKGVASGYPTSHKIENDIKWPESDRGLGSILSKFST